MQLLALLLLSETQKEELLKYLILSPAEVFELWYEESESTVAQHPLWTPPK